MFSIAIGWAAFSIGMALISSINDLLIRTTNLDHKSEVMVML